MKNLNELRNNLSEVFTDLREGEIDAKTTKELANVAGKIINTAKVQLEYYAMRKETPTITFIANDES